MSKYTLQVEVDPRQLVTYRAAGMLPRPLVVSLLRAVDRLGPLDWAEIERQADELRRQDAEERRRRDEENLAKEGSVVENESSG